MLVTVKNQGLGLAGRSKTEVDFFDLGVKVTKDTQELGSNEPTDLLFDTPLGFGTGFDPSKFKITVDVVPEQVDEANETNNIAFGVCEVIN